jgi:hypothetical protein
MCQHGVTTSINGKATGAVWTCLCGQSHCRHIDACPCGRTRARRFIPGDTFTLLEEQTDDNDGTPRTTPAGSEIVIERIEPDNLENPFVVLCRATGGWWFFSRAELERQEFRKGSQELPRVVS